MIFLLILFQLTPFTLLTKGNYHGAINAYEQQLNNASREDSFSITVDIGDIYLYWLWEPDSALKFYKQAIKGYSKEEKIGSVLYRMGHAYELQEDFQKSARHFSDVVTKHRKCPLVNQALSAVERSFRKNYQDVVVRINGWPITRIELDEIIQDMPVMMREAYKRPEKIKQLLDRLIIERLIFVYAKERQYDTIPEVYKQYTYANRNYLKDIVMMVDVFSKVSVSEEEIKKYYQEHKEDYRLKKRVKVKEIVVESESLAQVLLDSVKVDSSAWGPLAKAYSISPTKHSGGVAGYLIEGIKPPDVDSILFTTPAGEITPVVMTDTNEYAFYYITESRPEHIRGLDKVKYMVRSAIENKKKAKLQKALEDSLLATIDTVEYYLNEEHGDTLVRYDHHYITQEDVDFKYTQLPPFSREEHQQYPDRFHKLLKDMVIEGLKFIAAVNRNYYLGDTTFITFGKNRRKTMLSELWQREIVQKANVTEEEIKNYYQEHIDDEFTVPAQVRLRALITKDKHIADSIYQSLKYRVWYWPFSQRYRSDVFDSLVTYYSVYPDTLRGTDLGFVIKGSSPEIDSLIFPKKKGTIVEPLFNADDSTYTLYYIINKNPIRKVPFKNAQSKIERNMRRKRLAKRREGFLNQLKENAKVEYFLPETMEVEKEEDKKKEDKKKD